MVFGREEVPDREFVTLAPSRGPTLIAKQKVVEDVLNRAGEQGLSSWKAEVRERGGGEAVEVGGSPPDFRAPGFGAEIAFM